MPWKRKIHCPFKWIQLIEGSNYLDMNSRLHYQINWKDEVNFCKYASEIFASYIWRSLFLVKLQAVTSLNWSPSQLFSRDAFQLDSIQYNAAMAMTGAIRGTSKEKLYDKLGLETLEKRRWYRKLCCFLRFADINVQSTYSVLFPLLWLRATQEILIIFLYSK